METNDQKLSDAKIEILDFIEAELLEIVNATKRLPVKAAGLEILAAWKAERGAPGVDTWRGNL